MRGDLYPVNEVFGTIQGEGTWTGTPALFMRLQRCPVGCPWCDTKYTWPLKTRDIRPLGEVLLKKKEAQTYALAEVGELLAVALSNKPKHVVITGGEPCLYDLRSLSARLIDAGFFVQVETSGTQEIRIHDQAWVTVSPKVNMPGGYPVLLTALRRANEIKHPVGKPRDIEQLRDLLRLIAPQQEPTVFLQPLSLSHKATALCVKAASDNGWRVSLQAHRLAGLR